MNNMVEPSVSGYNEYSRFFQIKWDNGDGIPNKRDLYIDVVSERPVPFGEVASDLRSYYRETKAGGQFPAQGGGWELLAEPLEEKLPRRFQLEKLLDSCTLPLEVYTFAAYIVYQPQEQLEMFLAFLELAPLSLDRLQVIERTAKARGNIAFGRKVHQIFEERFAWDQADFEEIKVQDPDLGELGIRDRWGDKIFLQGGGTSLKAWKDNNYKLTYSEQRMFVTALAFFVSVDFQMDPTAEAINRFSRYVSDTYALGIATPPFIKFSPSEGGYDARMDTVTIDSDDGNAGDYYHEVVGHFAPDIMDDAEGPNNTMFFATPRSPLTAGGTSLFDPEDCNITASVSEYGGVCDTNRTYLEMGGHKTFEDPAETLEWVAAERIEGRMPDLALPVLERVERLNKMIEASLRIGRSAPPQMIGRIVELTVEIATHFYPHSTLSPQYKHGTPLESFLREMQSWVRVIQRQHIPGGARKRKEKMAWARGVLDYFRPTGHRLRPHPDITRLPWGCPIN